MHVAIMMAVAMVWTPVALAQASDTSPPPPSSPPSAASPRASPPAPAPAIMTVRHPDVVPAYARVPPPVFSPGPPAAPLPVTSVAIRMTLGSETLWTGTLRIGGGGPARLSLIEPVAMTAPCDRARFDRGGRQIQLSIQPQTYPTADRPQYRLSASYIRPSIDQNCVSGSRSVSIEQSFSLDGKKPLSFEGDGGLKVQIIAP